MPLMQSVTVTLTRQDTIQSWMVLFVPFSNYLLCNENLQSVTNATRFVVVNLGASHCQSIACPNPFRI